MKTAEVVKNLRRGYLFKLDRALRKRFNALQIPGEATAKFIELGYFFKRPSVKRIIKGKQWVIIDGDLEFSVEKEQDELVVCDLSKVLTQSVLAKRIGITQGTVGNLEHGKAKLTKVIADALVDELWLNDKQADVVMIAAARDYADRIKENFDIAMVKLKRQFGDYPEVMLFLRREYGGRQWK